jgi:hypothetical protein
MRAALVCTNVYQSALSLPSRTGIVFDRDVTVKASSKNEFNLQNLIKAVKFLVSTLFLVERCVSALQLLSGRVKCH